jgi:hypothetical protein
VLKTDPGRLRNIGKPHCGSLTNLLWTFDRGLRRDDYVGSNN